MTTEVDLEKPKAMNKKVLIGVITIIIVVAGYFGYQYYQTSQYVKKITPQILTFELLIQDTEKLANQGNGKRFVDLFEEGKRIKQAYKDIKMKVVEIPPTTKKAHEINNKFNTTIDSQIELLDSITNVYQSRMKMQSSRRILEKFNEESYIPVFAQNIVKQEIENFKEAKNNLEEANLKYDDALEKTKIPLQKLYESLGKPIPENS